MWHSPCLMVNPHVWWLNRFYESVQHPLPSSDAACNRHIAPCQRSLLQHVSGTWLAYCDIKCCYVSKPCGCWEILGQRRVIEKLHHEQLATNNANAHALNKLLQTHSKNAWYGSRDRHNDPEAVPCFMFSLNLALGWFMMFAYERGIKRQCLNFHKHVFSRWLHSSRPRPPKNRDSHRQRRHQQADQFSETATW